MIFPTSCPECGAGVLECDNRVRLDYPAVAFDRVGSQWTIMQLGNLHVAAAGQASAEGTGHRLHEHQPPEDE